MWITSLNKIRTHIQRIFNQLPISFPFCFLVINLLTIIGGHNIYIKREADGIIIDVDAYGTLTGDIISTLGVTNNDIEEDLLESYGLDGDEVAEWVGLHYKVNFDTESYFKRYEWIERYIESNSV